MSRYLVTGGAGFIGSHIVNGLLDRGHEVRVVDNLSSGRRENMAGFLDRIEFIEGDLRNMDDCRQSVEGMDFVLHQAALPSVPRSVADPILSNEHNIRGTLNLLVAARDAKVKRVVYAASSAAYGNTPTLPKEESMTPDPLSPYAIAKLVGEQYCRVFHSLYGLEAVALRYFNVFGPRQDPTSQYSAVIPKFIVALLEGRNAQIYGDGEQSRDFTFVDNVVEANLLAVTAPNAPGRVINIACGKRITLNKLAEQLQEMVGGAGGFEHVEERAGDVLHSLADISLAREILDYEPRVSVEEGLKKTVEWYKENRS